MAEIEDNIRRSDEINDIIGKVPNWLARWGSILVFVFMCLIVLIAYFVKYPETVPGQVIITCQNPPADLVARSNGRIKFFIKENQAVKASDYIAIIENTAELDEVMELRKALPAYDSIINDPITLLTSEVKFTNKANLGEIHNSYNDFKQTVDEYRLFIDLQQNHEKIKGYSNQIKYLTEHYNLLNKKKHTLEKGYSITLRQYNADKLLFEKGYISQIEIEKSENALNQSAYTIQEIEEEKINNQKEIQRLKSSITELLTVDKDTKSKLEFKLKISYKNLKAAFLNWQQKYIITAPIDGKLTFYDYWNNNQFIKEGIDIAYIVPDASTIFGKLYVKGTSFGKVKIGQKVRIMLDNYPMSEFGVIFGKVNSISEKNKNNIYVINISLPNGLISNYNQKIAFRHEMNGNGEVITQNLNIIDRIIYKSRKIFAKTSY